MRAGSALYTSASSIAPGPEEILEGYLRIRCHVEGVFQTFCLFPTSLNYNAIRFPLFYVQMLLLL
jgi:hypothetical protein